MSSAAAMPVDVGIVDTMLGIPTPSPPRSYDFMRPLFRDAESPRQFDFPVEYMFRDVPKTGSHDDTIAHTLGCEPWEELAVKLMLEWPNLYYSTSAFAPKYYPKATIDYANTRGADKVIYGGYWPMGLTLERIFRDMRGVPFAEHVWPEFLRENALRIPKLDG